MNAKKSAIVIAVFVMLLAGLAGFSTRWAIKLMSQITEIVQIKTATGDSSNKT